MGRGNRDNGSKIVGTTFVCLLLSGIAVSAVVGICMEPLLNCFGAKRQNSSYATAYVSVINIGIPYLLISTGGSHLIRADGKPEYAMIAVIVGAVLNMILDPLFIFLFHWGIAGAAWATVISQIISGLFIIAYLPRYQSFTLKWIDFVPGLNSLKSIIPLGASVCINQIAILVQQITVNNVLRIYGARSIYGSDTPLAAMGIISKISMIVTAVALGIAQGSEIIDHHCFCSARQLNSLKIHE